MWYHKSKTCLMTMWMSHCLVLPALSTQVTSFKSSRLRNSQKNRAFIVHLNAMYNMENLTFQYHQTYPSTSRYDFTVISENKICDLIFKSFKKKSFLIMCLIFPFHSKYPCRLNISIYSLIYFKSRICLLCT